VLNIYVVIAHQMIIIILIEAHIKEKKTNTSARFNKKRLKKIRRIRRGSTCRPSYQKATTLPTELSISC
jgi:hypothetical protein